MRLHLDYGSNGLDVDLPDERVTVIEPILHPSLQDPAGALTSALRSPIAGRPLRDIVKPGQRVAISVCDLTRAQPRREMLNALMAEMASVRSQDIVILVATGTHRANTDAELEMMFGVDICRRFRIVNHDSRNESSLTCLGVTASGVPIYINRLWIEADIRITTGFVEPHFFAGFSGGPKMVAPGLAGLQTVQVLHDAKRIGHPKATWGVTVGNPIHDDVREISQIVGVDFAVDVTLNRRKQITAVFAGDLLAEHHAACQAVERDAMRPVDDAFDVVLTTNSGFPLDQNLYQAVKGMSAAAKVTKPGGTIICAAECSDGLPSHGSYGEILASRSSPEELLGMINQPGYARPDQWQVQIQAQILARARVLVKTSGLSPQAVRAAHLQPIDDVSDAVAHALNAAGPAATLCVLPQGPQTIPYLRAR